MDSYSPRHLGQMGAQSGGAHQAEGGVGVGDPHAEGEEHHQPQGFGDHDPAPPVLAVLAEADLPVVLVPPLPEGPELLRQGLAVRVGLEYIVRPLLQSIAVAEQQGWAVARVGAWSGEQLGQLALETAQNVQRAVPAAVIHNDKAALRTGALDHSMPFPATASMLASSL